MVTWPDTFKINTNWNDSVNVAAVSNSPEYGPPIRRIKSRNTKHTVTISFTLDINEYNTTFKQFISDINGGADSFQFPELTNPNASALNYVTAYISDTSAPYSITRNDNYTYTISMTIAYYKVGVI